MIKADASHLKEHIKPITVDWSVKVLMADVKRVPSYFIHDRFFWIPYTFDEVLVFIEPEVMHKGDDLLIVGVGRTEDP